jgi:beta-N-acetylhexosaminidase
MKFGRFLAALLLAAACFAAKPPAKAPAKPKAPAIPLTAEQRAAQNILKSMTLRDKAAQLVIVVSNGDVLSTKSPEHEKYRHWIRDLHVGGIIVNNTAQYGVVRNAEPHAMAVFLNQMQRLSKVPLLVASDFERGASMRVGGGTRFPHSMAFGLRAIWRRRATKD